MDPASTIVGRSRESKNTSHWAHERGRAAEAKVAAYFQSKNFKILKQRWRTPYAEIDLLLQSPRGEIFLIEVKTLSHFDFLQDRVGPRQKARLQRAAVFVQSKTTRPVRLALAFVDRSGKILIFENF